MNHSLIFSFIVVVGQFLNGQSFDYMCQMWNHELFDYRRKKFKILNDDQMKNAMDA